MLLNGTSGFTRRLVAVLSVGLLLGGAGVIMDRPASAAASVRGSAAALRAIAGELRVDASRLSTLYVYSRFVAESKNGLIDLQSLRGYFGGRSAASLERAIVVYNSHISKGSRPSAVALLRAVAADVDAAALQLERANYSFEITFG